MRWVAILALVGGVGGCVDGSGGDCCGSGDSGDSD